MMDLNSPSSDYLTYKKSKMNPNRVQRVEKRVEKIKRIVKVSVITFCVMFLCVVIFIKKYAKRVDIEYGRNGLSNPETSSEQGFGESYDNDKRTIDKRLTLIRDEENAPSESRVLDKDRDKNEVMNFEQFAKLKEENYQEDIQEDEKPEQKPVQPKQEVQKPQVQPQAQPQNNVNLLPKKEVPPSLSLTSNGDFTPVEAQAPSNIKVLIGKYPSFEDAKKAQLIIKERSKISPFIRRVGSGYSLQIGSYSNMDVARSVAANYSRMGLEVWIYQQ